MSDSSPRWTIRELGERAEAALAVGYAGPASGQVRAVPDVRTIRYYTTIGLLGRPAEMRGRTALYSTRHLAQLVAVKRLQEHGRTLAEIQAELAGASDKTLARLARLPADAAPSPRRRAAPARADFWSAEPAEPVEVTPRPVAADAPIAILLAELELAAGVRLAFHTDSPPSTDAILALRRAAEPLLRELRNAGLLTT
jgi:DNA-binding transcriptional MerR regulator